MYRPLEIKKELDHCRWVLKRNNIAPNRSKPFMWSMFDSYHIDILLYKRVLNVLKTTKAEQIEWLFLCDGTLIIKHKTGEFNINLINCEAVA